MENEMREIENNNNMPTRGGFVKLHPTTKFDPVAHIRINELGKPYLPINAKKLWFRSVFPDGVIKISIVSESADHATVRARVYEKRADEEDKYISEAYARRVPINDPIKMNHLDEAQRAAVSTALTDAGFTTGYSENDRPDGTTEEQGNQKTEQQKPLQTNVQSSKSQTPAKELSPRPNSVISPTNGQYVTPVGARNQQTNSRTGKEKSVSGSGLIQESPLTAARAVQLNDEFGAFNGYTLGQVADRSDWAQNLQWIVYSYRGNNQQVREAATLIYNYKMKSA